MSVESDWQSYFLQHHGTRVSFTSSSERNSSVAGSLFLPVMLILVQIKFTTFQQLDGADPEVVVDFFVGIVYVRLAFFPHMLILKGNFQCFLPSNFFCSNLSLVRLIIP